jgi:hypothetical protein
MTDTRTEGWWQASDGNWYPPELRPHAPIAPPPAATQPVAAERPKPRNGKKIALWSAAIIVGLGVLGNLTDDAETTDGADSIAASASTTSKPAEASTPTTEKVSEKAPPTTEPPTTTAAPTTTARPTTTTTINVKALRVIDMRAWVDDNGSIMSDITDDMGDVTDAASSFDVQGLGTACLGLRGSILQAQAMRPIPEPSVNTPWQKALASYKKAADTCIAGARTIDADLITTASEYMADGTTYMQDATAALTRWMADNDL